MNCTLSNILIFAAGIAIGSIVTWKYTKTKYEQIAREEINSVKERYAKRHSEPIKTAYPTFTDANEFDDETMEEYERMTERYGKPEKTEPAFGAPYVIPPEEYGEKDDYECESLIYFADNVLADECYEPVLSINNTVGREALSSFGEYEDDAVHVRNDELKKDYEILLDMRRYSDVVCNGPQLTEDE